MHMNQGEPNSSISRIPISSDQLPVNLFGIPMDIVIRIASAGHTNYADLATDLELTDFHLCPSSWPRNQR
jgi:hypothetical protein